MFLLEAFNAVQLKIAYARANTIEKLLELVYKQQDKEPFMFDSYEIYEEINYCSKKLVKKF